ncbi:hypothetical protein B0T16DRAFT_27889 [Cercophora newfieldiana]|uniref:Metallo-beta-lactamase domain-containing protein n=1 Tax=Cercophora newfieldiana TaxID=92897 RepID=A0AA39YP18_9PEZI|nr:hypothetical protein B0T16DRAFT_27889 [Cercophora newfieldiana]
MALTITQLNGDASFLLALEPPVSDPLSKPFYIALDPWLSGSPFTILHPKISITTHEKRACITSLLDLPELDLVIISQNRADHLDPATLRQIPSRGTKTIILAEPGSARAIRSWGYFEDGKVVTMPKYNHRTSCPRVVRIPVPNGDAIMGKAGEVTVAFIPQRHDISRLHMAVAITYRPPIAQPSRPSMILTPPATPISHVSSPLLRVPGQTTEPTMLHTRAMSPSTRQYSRHSVASLSPLKQPLSVIFSPHGIKYSSIHSYVTHHLVSEAALPLTALLHCFDTVSSRWLGKVLLGAPSGVEICSRLGARAWFSTHDDGNKISGGILSRILRTTRHCRGDILRQLNSPEPSLTSTTSVRKYATNTTGVFALAIGETMTVSSEGIHHQEPNDSKPHVSTRHRRGESWLDLDEDSEESNKVVLPRVPLEASPLSGNIESEETEHVYHDVDVYKNNQLN